MTRLVAQIASAFRRTQHHANPLNAMPDFSKFTYAIACPPPAPKIPAWDKLRECERRLEFYRWAESLNDPARPQHRIILDDALAAFLLSFEATFQHVRDAFSRLGAPTPFWEWVRANPDYGLLVMGIRTIRHIEAHVRDIPIGSLVKVKIGDSLPEGGSHVQVSRTWRLPSLSAADLASLRTPALEAADLPQWNSLVEQTPASDLLDKALRNAHGILVDAEAAVL